MGIMRFISRDAHSCLKMRTELILEISIPADPRLPQQRKFTQKQTDARIVPLIATPADKCKIRSRAVI